MKRRLLILFSVPAVFFMFGGQTAHAQCIPTYVDDCIYGDGINDFILNGSGISHIGSGCSTNGYGDFTATPGLYGTLQASVSYTYEMTHNYPSSQFTKIWIDFDNNNIFDEVTELVFASTDGSVDGVSGGSFLLPMSTPAATGVRMRVMTTYAGLPSGACATDAYYGETHDYTVDILPPPACPNPLDLTLVDVTPVTADIAWTEQGTATDYAVEWGLPGFTPGTGSDLGNAVVPGATTYQVTGLTPATDYEFYVVANCGVDGFSYWAGPFAFTTECVPVTTLPWTEDFESVTDIGMFIYPNCWSHENVGSTDGWNVYNNAYEWSDADALSGTNFLTMQYGGDAYIWTPEFELTAGVTYEFVFNWAGDGYDGWTGEAVVNTTASSAGATVLGDPFVIQDETTSMTYQEEIYCFTPDVNGLYTFAIHVTENYWWYYLSVDDVSLRVADPVAGTDAAYDACITEGMIDLDIIGSIVAPGGTWSAVNPLAVSGNQLDVTLLPSVSQVVYEPAGCQNDVIIDLTIYGESSAGEDGTLEACMNQQVDLLGGLSGAVSLGGTWYDQDDNALTGSYFMTGTTPGDYDYSYVAGNGVCPDDTAVVTLTILPCDYLEMEELNTFDVIIYPNPSAGIFTVTPAAEFNDYTMVITDLNGRVVMTSAPGDSQNGAVHIDLSGMEDGIYLMRIFNETQTGVYKLIKK